MPALLLLGIGVACALISRVLLIAAAFSTSIWWGIGVLLPFGPMFFRLAHRDEAARARLFSLASLPCFFGFFAMGGVMPTASRNNDVFQHKLSAAKPTQFALKVPHRPSADGRRAANQQELARLQEWDAKLRVTKRDLLHSDVEGNRRYAAELAQYNAALAAANAEKAALASAH